MTAKEKAMQIAMKFNKKGETDNAKQCALICVDEILGGSRLFYIEDYSYWKEVKEEIIKI